MEPSDQHGVGLWGEWEPLYPISADGAEDILLWLEPGSMSIGLILSVLLIPKPDG